MKKGIPDIICGLLILLFVYAAMSKLLDRQHFQGVLAQMPLIQYAAGFISVALPLLEGIVCALLFMRTTRLLGLYASFGILVSFTVFIGYMILFSPHLPCNCGGVLEQMSWTQHLVFNVVFITLSAIAIKLYPSSKILLQHNSRPYSGLQGKS